MIRVRKFGLCERGEQKNPVMPDAILPLTDDTALRRFSIKVFLLCYTESMTREITDIGGNTVELDCLSCAIAQNKVEIRGGSIIRSRHFDLHQDFEIPIPGFIILTSLRHLQSVDEFSDEESAEFMQVLRAARKLQREVLNIETVYLHQEEDTSHHFHMWMFPRYGWMKEQFGRKAESMRPIMEYARAELKTEANLSQLDVDVARLQNAAAQLQF